MNISEKFKKMKERFKTPENKLTKSTYPIINIEESFMLGGDYGETRFRVIFEVPVPVPKNASKEEVEEYTKITDDTFRPIVEPLTYYLRGLITENSSERFLLGRRNLIDAIKQCARAQLKILEEAEKNR